MTAGRTLLEGGRVQVTVDGSALEIQPDEVDVRANAHEGFVVASEGSNIAALVTSLTPELIREGLAREFIRRVQDLRKGANFEVADRIEIRYRASAELTAAVGENESYIANETLAAAIGSGELPEGWATAEDTFDGETLAIAIRAING